MKTFEEDNELRALIKSVKMESPGNDFSKRVMNRIFEEQSSLEQVKAERILGKGFWIILALFIALFAAMFAISTTGATDGGFLENTMQSATSGNVSQGYENFLEKLTSALPVSAGGILLASSLLVFLDRFLSSRSKKIFHN